MSTEPDVLVYEEHERISLNSMSDEEFYEQFADCTRLLLHHQDRTVLATSRSGDKLALLKAFREKFKQPETRELIFWTGPKGLKKAFLP